MESKITKEEKADIIAAIIRDFETDKMQICKGLSYKEHQDEWTKMLANVYDKNYAQFKQAGQCVGVWVNFTYNEDLIPKESEYDEPERYLVRGKGDDPRTGWIFASYLTAEEMLHQRKNGHCERLEFLDESQQSQPQQSSFKKGDVVYDKKGVKHTVHSVNGNIVECDYVRDDGGSLLGDGGFVSEFNINELSALPQQSSPIADMEYIRRSQQPQEQEDVRSIQKDSDLWGTPFFGEDQ